MLKAKINIVREAPYLTRLNNLYTFKIEKISNRNNKNIDNCISDKLGSLLFK